MVNMLTETEKSEFVLYPDHTEFFTRQELPQNKYLELLKAVKNDKPKEYMELLTLYKMSTIDMVTGLDAPADFGNRKDIKGEQFNPLHWAVYTNNLKATKAIVENQIFNIIIAGKVPTNTGLANESEMSIEEINEESPNVKESQGSIKRKTTKRLGPLTISEKRYGSVPRSLILFWAIDRDYLELFEYLWELPDINWGLKNLKFNLAMICIKENPKLFEKFLMSQTFVRIINSLPFDDAMDFLEAFIIKNERIPDDMKFDLFKQKGMLVYDFMGELLSLENTELIREIHEQLEAADFDRIKSGPKAMQKIEELKKYVEKMDNSEEQEEIEELLEGF